MQATRWYRRLSDPVSFVVGLAFVAIAGGLSMAGVDVPGGGMRWLGAFVLLVLGTVLLLGSKTGLSTERIP
jgi:hypothetical protein